MGRSTLLYQIKQRLCSAGNSTFTALSGLPGVGKTTLAVTLANDSYVQKCFADGILWAGLGPEPHILELLSRWGSLLNITHDGGEKLAGIEDWARAMRAAIGTRRMLLVIDDVWRIEDALAFKMGGPRCSYLLTTRFPHLAVQFTADGSAVVPELSEQDGVELMQRLAPEMTKLEPTLLETLVRSVGGLPLALTLMGRYLRRQAYSGQPRRLRMAIHNLHDINTRLRLAEPQSLLERSPHLPGGTAVSLEAVIEVSEQQLNDDARQALRALSIFPTKPNTFSEQAALAVSAVSVETLDILLDTGLLEGSGAERYYTASDHRRLCQSSPAGERCLYSLRGLFCRLCGALRARGRSA